MNQNGFFVTGTDTGIGKTFISKLLADTFSTIQAVTYMKPVQTGCEVDSSGNLISPDLEYVISGGARLTGTYNQHIPYMYRQACSPHLAASLNSDIISPQKILKYFEEISRPDTMVIVEGAGGLMVPLGENFYMLDLINLMGLPVILVTSPHLGTLNHTFLSIKALRQSGASLAAVVLNNCRNEPETIIYQDNRRIIGEYIKPVDLLEVKHGSSQCEQILQFCSRNRG